MQKIVSAVSNQIQQFANPTVTKRYKLEGTIGKGNFSQVKRATDRQTGQEVAVKVLSLATLKDKEKVGVHSVSGFLLFTSQELFRL